MSDGVTKGVLVGCAGRATRFCWWSGQTVKMPEVGFAWRIWYLGGEFAPFCCSF